MPSVTNSITSILESILNTITSLFTGVLAIFQHILNIFLGVFQTTFAAVGQAISGLAQTFQGLLKFLLSEYFRNSFRSQLPVQGKTESRIEDVLLRLGEEGTREDGRAQADKK